MRQFIGVCAGITLMIASMSQHTNATNPPFSVTVAENQLGLTFSPDGTVAYWVAWTGNWGSNAASRQIIYSSRLQHGEWSSPEPVEFSGQHSDSDPLVSPDGRWLYFVSKRPTSADDETDDGNIWRYSLTKDNQPELLSVNSDAEEYSPVVISGALYFASDRNGGMGQGDLYRAATAADGFLAPQALGPAFNTPTGEWNLWVSADDSEIIFEASSRSTNISIPGDLYYSWRTPAGWTAAVAIKQLNTRNSDLMPRLHPNGQTLYYTSAPIGGHAKILAAKWAPLRTALRSHYAPTLMVANRSSHEVTFVDLSRGEVVDRVANGEDPHLLSNASAGRVLATAGRIWVTNAMDGSVSIVHPLSGTVVGHVASVCGFPIALSRDAGGTVWVACFSSSELVAIDHDSFKIMSRIKLADQPLNLLTHPEHQLAYVSLPRQNAIAEIELESGSELRRINVGIEPDGLQWVLNRR